MEGSPELGARIRSEVVPQATKFALEKLVPPLEIERLKNPSYEKAKNLESQGFSQAAASHYLTLAQNPELSSDERALNWVQASQMFINLFRFRQARECLREAKSTALLVESAVDRKPLLASVSEKYGWIDDYEGDFASSLKHFSEARDIVERIPFEARGEMELGCLSTADHFSGRAHLGLALYGVEREGNLRRARHYFGKDRERFRILRQESDPQPANEWFQEAWLTRCDLAEGKVSDARQRLGASRRFIDEFLSTHPGDGIEAHYFVLDGAIYLAEGNTRKAREQFENALEIRFRNRNEGRPYQKGEADALAGIASTYWAERKFGMAASFGIGALKRNPFALIRPF